MKVLHLYGIEDRTPVANGSVMMNELVFLPSIVHVKETPYWSSSIALGHVRLEINDLSPAGAQPFSDVDDTIHAVVNGTIRRS